MKLRNNNSNDKMELQIAPLIDVVFLLLIYFIMAAKLIKKEGDIKFVLPAPPTNTKNIELPVEARIQIDKDGYVTIDGQVFEPDDIRLQEMANHLRGLRVMAEGQGSKFFVNVAPTKETLHDRVINVMDACGAAQVKNLTFSDTEM